MKGDTIQQGFFFRTGKMVPFLEVGMGQPFYAHGKVWVRTSYEAATELTSTPIRHGGKLIHASCCNFVTDECDKNVEAVIYSRSPERFKSG